MDSTQSEPIFKFIDFSPIGFKENNYPVQLCSICKGELNEICHFCLENGQKECVVTNNNNDYYHTHCYSALKEKENVKPHKAEMYSSESDGSESG